MHVPKMLLVHPTRGWLQRKPISICPAKKYCETLKVLCALALSILPLSSLLKSMIQFNHEAVDEWWKLVNNWNSIMRSNFVCSRPSVKYIYRERIMPQRGLILFFYYFINYGVWIRRCWLAASANPSQIWQWAELKTDLLASSLTRSHKFMSSFFPC